MSSVNVQNLRISIKAYESNILDDTCLAIMGSINASGSKAIGPIPLPTKLRRYCVLTSPHVNKKARDHFEIRTHKRLLDIIDPTPQTVDALMKLDLAAGVDVEIKL